MQSVNAMIQVFVAAFYLLVYSIGCTINKTFRGRVWDVRMFLFYSILFFLMPRQCKKEGNKIYIQKVTHCASDRS